MAESKIQSGHVYYFEPNDTNIGKDQNGQSVPLTPHFEDLCISMSLWADIYPRDKGYLHTLKDVENDNAARVQKKISWICYQDSKIPQQLTSYGSELGNDRFLTTFYTEISADQYIENEIVEGLGVTGVNISFESWYTPTITINFVDVHGSALWGREEAIHDNGDITASNILGVFFTQPYPLFRLQIKGFLGQAVTYQLSVSSFKGRYNSQTGNFEATATFIGYNYSLLTDIPLKLLSVIPETDYAAKKYWQTHVTSPEWQLKNEDGTETQPMPLFVLIENIRSAIGSLDSVQTKNCQGVDINVCNVDGNGTVINSTEKDQNVSLSSASVVTDATNKNSGLFNIKSKLDDFIKACQTSCVSTYNGMVFSGFSNESNSSAQKKEQMLFVFGNSDDTWNFSSKMKSTYKDFCKAVDEYNTQQGSKVFHNAIQGTNRYGFHKVANGEVPKKGVLLTKIFKKTNIPTFNVSNGIQSQSTQKIYINSGSKIQDIKVNNDALYPSVASQLETAFNNTNNNKIPHAVLGEYAFLLPLGTMRSELSQSINSLTANSQNIETAAENKTMGQSNSTQTIKVSSSKERDKVIEETKKYKIMQLIGFEPTIGNFVKLMMCHLETFVETMFTCAENIYANKDKRTPQLLGLGGLEFTDIPKTNGSARDVTNNGKEKLVGPWPALYNPTYDANNNETSITDKTDKYEALGWPLDYKTKDGVEWEEGKLVLSFLDAISRCKELLENKYKNGHGNAFASIPLSGMDLGNLISPFTNIGSTWKNLECLSGYLGLRMAQIIGVGDNNCTEEIAEALGSIDALNLMMTTVNPIGLQEAIKPKDGNQDFKARVIEYLTCDNKTKSSNETEDGKSYNVFEMSSHGSFYHNNRHPIFVSEGNDKYKYSYTYTRDSNYEDKMISVVPTELFAFTSTKNHYANLLVPKTEKNGRLEFFPKICGRGNQCWVYTTKSDNLKIVKDSTGYETAFTNNQMFTILSDTNLNLSLINEIKNLKDGALKIRGLSIKGANEDDKVKKFVERKYQISDNDYAKFYFLQKNYRIVSPPIDILDENYSKEHLCLTDDKKVDVTFDSQWCYDTNSSLYKKMTLYRDGDNFAFKNNEKSFSNEDISVIDLPIMVNSKTIGSLFGSKLYYMQNDIQNNDALRRLSKAYLILSSLMAGIDAPEESFFKSDDHSIIKRMPPFYVLFIGALVWRNSLTGDEDLYFGDYANVKPDKDTSLISKTEKILYFDTTEKKDWYKLSDYFMEYDKIDLSVRNKLIEIFKAYAMSNVFENIIKSCELVKSNKECINSTEFETLKQTWSKSDFDTKSAEKWASLFGDMFSNYCSFVLPESKQVLRLMFNRNGNGVKRLNFLYGILNPFIIGRATTKRVGTGESEVHIRKNQMLSYLKGFEERIKSIGNETKEEDKKTEGTPSTNVSHDHAVSMYYSFKHLWDTWLVTAARDQFKIRNFFEKYFIFMDSFYVNVYDKIKLNAEVINTAYNNDEQNLLTFITNITSKEGCMFFALPDFVDSNVDVSTVGEYAKKNGRASEYSWKKDNLEKIFTPIPYNEMNPPQTNNTFVFIYTHQFSDNALENTDKKFDSYMMNDRGNWPSVLTKGVLKETSANADNKLDANDASIEATPTNSLLNSTEALVSGRYGYMMPCFGVTVNRGNNYIFKSINVNMDSPKITAVSAQTWENILTKTGADGSKRIFFHGQDIYSIYSQYSYACEIEMMGCAQIQPLMYFQLLNIPMWRGTYMIYKVTHSMTPGNMVTKFTGMKMSRKQTPYASGYFTVGKESSKNLVTINGNNNNGNSGEGVVNNGMYYEGQGAVGGEKMIKAIFGGFTGYKTAKSGYGSFGFPRKNGDTFDHHHAGVDITAPEGTPLYAPWDGKIIRAQTSWSGNPKKDSAGKHLTFQDSTGKHQVKYLHCSEIVGIKDHTYKKGELIAKVGHTGGNAATGGSCGAHLHLELYINGKFNWGTKLRSQGGTLDAVDPLIEHGGLSSTSTPTQVQNSST